MPTSSGVRTATNSIELMRRLPEDRITQQLDVVVQADEVAPLRREALPLVEAQQERVDRRVEDEGAQHQQRRPDEGVGRQVALDGPAHGWHCDRAASSDDLSQRCTSSRRPSSTPLSRLPSPACGLATREHRLEALVHRLLNLRREKHASRPVGCSFRNSGYSGSFSFVIWHASESSADRPVWRDPEPGAVSHLA